MVAVTQEPLNLLEVESVPLPAWTLLFDEIGYPPGLGAGELTYEAILTERDTLSAKPEFHAALQMLDEFGNEDGQEALREAALDRGFALDAWPKGEGPKERTMRFFVERRKQAGLDEVVARARVRVQERGRVRPSLEFAGDEPRAVAVGERAVLITKFESELKAVFGSHDLGDHLEVQFFDDDGDFHIHVIRGGAIRKPLAVESDRRRLIQYRPVQSDLFRYEPDTGRLRISTRLRSLVRAFRFAFGRVFFGDEAFFSDGETCSLEILRQGPSCLKTTTASQVASASLRSCIVRVGDEVRMQISGKDCFRQLQALLQSQDVTDVVEARLALRLWDENRRQVMVTIRAPNRVDFDRKFNAADIDEYLTQVGIRSKPVARASDLWSLAHSRHTQTEWRLALGREFDRFVTTALLLPQDMQQVAHPNYPEHGKVLTVHAVDPAGRDLYGVSDDEFVQSRSVTFSDVEGYALDLAAYGRAIAGDLSLTGNVNVIASGGIVDLGARSFGTKACRLILLAKSLEGSSTEIARGLHDLAKPSMPVLLVPAGRSSGTSWPEVYLPSLAGPFGALKDEIVRTLCVEDELTACERAPHGTRLIIDSRAGSAWLDGLAIDVGRDTLAFRVLERVARAGGQPVSSQDLRELGGARLKNGDDSAHRQAKREVVKSIGKTLVAAGKTAPGTNEIISYSKRSGGFTCNVRAYVV